MKHLTHKLKKKGWKEHDIEKAIDILKKAKRPSHVKREKMAYWIALVVSIFGNLAISFAIMPVILTSPKNIVLMVTAALGACFGFLIDIFIRDLEHLDHRHYLVSGIILPIISCVNLMFAYNLTYSFISKELGNINVRYHDPYMIAGIYIISFMLPHAIYKLYLHYALKK